MAKYFEAEINYEWNNGILEEKPMASVRQSKMFQWFQQLIFLYLDSFSVAQVIMHEVGNRFPKRSGFCLGSDWIYVRGEFCDGRPKLGADPNIQDSEGRTAIYVAAARGDRKAVLSLKNANANYFIQESDLGLNPMHIAIINGHTDVFELLYEIDQRFLYVKDNQNKLPIHFAAQKQNIRRRLRLRTCRF